MTLDTRGFMDGAMKGFSLMDAYQTKEHQKERQARLDQEEKERYQMTLRQYEQSRQDKLNYQAKTLKLAQATQDMNNKLTESNIAKNNKDQKLRDIDIETSEYELNRKKRTGFITDNLPLIQAGVDRWRDTGEVSEILDHEYVAGGAYDPRSYDSEMMTAAYDIENRVPQALNGEIDYRDTKLTKSIGVFLRRNAQQGIGDKDPETGKVITNKEYLRHDLVADIDPNREGDQPGVVVGLKITYDDGTTKTAPVTENRSTSKNDAVKVIPLDAFLKDVTGQVGMAKKVFSSKHYRKLFGGSDDEKKNLDKLRDALAENEKDKAEAINGLMDPTPENIANVTKQYDERANALRNIYGTSGESHDPSPKPKPKAVDVPKLRVAINNWVGNDWDSKRRKEFVEHQINKHGIESLNVPLLQRNYDTYLVKVRKKRHDDLVANARKAQNEQTVKAINSPALAFDMEAFMPQ